MGSEAGGPIIASSRDRDASMRASLQTVPTSTVTRISSTSTEQVRRALASGRLQLGAGLPMVYGRVDLPTLYKLMHVVGYYRTVTAKIVKLVRQSQANILARAMQDLACGVEEDCSRRVRLYVGHDTQLDGLAALLDLSWHAPPYPADSSPPGSMIRLTADGDGKVSAAFLSSTFDGEHAGAVSEVAATIDGKASMPLWELQKRVNETIDWGCVSA